MPKLSLIILSWNGRDHLSRCLGSIRDQHPAGHEIMIVDNASADDSIEVAKQTYPDGIIIPLKTNDGFCRPNNLAASRATGDYLAFLNNDVVLGPDFFVHLEEAIRKHDPDLLAVRMLQLRNPNLLDNCGIYFTFFGAGRQRLRGRQSNSAEAMQERTGVIPSGACFVIRRNVFLALNGFDERIVFNHEDLDLGLRAIACGLRCRYAPFPTIMHYGSASADVVSDKTYYFIQRNMEFVFAKNFSLANLLVRAIPHAVYAGYQLLKAVRQSKFKVFVHAKADAIRLLFNRPVNV